MVLSFMPLVRARPDRYDTSYEPAGDVTKEQGGEAGCPAMDRADLEQQLGDLHPASFAWALSCCGRDRDDAEEVLQETYLKIFDGSARFEGRSTLKTWLFSVIRRTAAARRRLRWLRSWRFVEADLDGMSAGQESAEQRVLYSERASALLRAISRLARRQREVIELVFYHDMT